MDHGKLSDFRQAVGPGKGEIQTNAVLHNAPLINLRVGTFKKQCSAPMCDIQTFCPNMVS